MIGFIIRIIGNCLALYAAVWLINDFAFSGGIKEYLIAGSVLGLLNLVVKPILKLISTPFIILTLGLFTIVINALILWVVDYMFDFMMIPDITTLLLATVIISIINIIVSKFAKK